MIKQSQLNLRAPMFVTVRPERLDEFRKIQSLHNKMLSKYPDGFNLYWHAEKESWRFVDDVNLTAGWYFTDHEITQYMELKKQSMQVEIKKAVILNDLRVTEENMEEIFEKIREMLK